MEITPGYFELEVSRIEYIRLAMTGLREVRSRSLTRSEPML